MSVSKTSNIVELRQLLAEKFPGVRMAAGRPPRIAERWSTGLPQFDSLLDGGLPKSAITEIVSAGVASGGALLLAALLHQAHENGQWMALIDGSNCFDAAALDNQILSRLLWVRCSEVRDAIKAADILLQDGSVSLTVMDLVSCPDKDVRRIRSSTWFRLQRTVETAPTAFVVLTPEPLISNAESRLTLSRRFTLDALEESRPLLLAQLTPQILQPAAAAPSTQKIA